MFNLYFKLDLLEVDGKFGFGCRNYTIEIIIIVLDSGYFDCFKKLSFSDQMQDCCCFIGSDFFIKITIIIIMEYCHFEEIFRD